MSKITIKNNINSELAITHADNKSAKSIIGTDIAVAVDTINDFPLDASDGDTVIVRDLNRGGTFIYDSSKVAERNDGTNFNGWIRQYSGAVNVKWFGAIGDGVTDIYGNYVSGTTDDYTIIQNVINQFDDIYIPKGVYLISQCLELYYTDIKIASSAIILKPNIAGFDAPSSLFWLKGKASLTSESDSSLSIIRSEIPTVNGLIKIGKDAPEIDSGYYASYNKVSGFTLYTKEIYANDGVIPEENNRSTAIMLNGTANESAKTPSYYNNITNMVIEGGDVGVWFRARASGNTVSNIRLIGCKINSIHLQGSVDNTISAMIDGAIAPAAGLLISKWTGIAGDTNKSVELSNKNNNIVMSCEMYSSGVGGAYPLVANESTDIGNSIIYSFTGPSAPNISDEFFINNVVSSFFDNKRQLTSLNSLYDSDNSSYINNSSTGTNTLHEGAIVERGSNASGYYTKFADGTLLCHGEIDLSSTNIAALTAFDNGDTTTRVDITLPHHYVGDIVSWSASLSADDAYYQNDVSMMERRNYRTSTRITLYIGMSYESFNSSLKLYWSTIGRWKIY